MSEELKPCPFCNVSLYECTYDLGKTRYAHEANGCTLSRKFVQGDLQIEAWNRRSMTNPNTETECRDIPTEILSKAREIYEGSWPDPVAAIAEALVEASGKSSHLALNPLCGHRFKLSFNKAGNCSSMGNFAKELDGQWVWLVDATDGRNNPRTMSSKALAAHIAALQQVLNEKREIESL